MKRRRALRSTAAVATAAGLAGCMGILGGGCSKPSGDIEDALPSGGDYEQQGDPSASSEGEDVEEGVTAGYEGPDGKQHIFVIIEYPDVGTAKEKIDGKDSPDRGQVGYVRVKNFVYVASGPDKDSVKSLLAEAKPLNESCVNSNVEWA